MTIDRDARERATGAIELVVLDEAECRRLLGTRVVGRVAVNRQGKGPLVVPVTYAVDPTGAIVFRTDPGTKLTRIGWGAVAFQIDDLDEATRVGWSVLVDGIGHETELSDAFLAEVEPWASGRKAHAVRIVPTTITGRRITRTATPSPA